MAPGGDTLIPGAARPAAVGAPLGRGGAGRCSWCPGSLRRAALAELQQFPGPRGEDVSGPGRFNTGCCCVPSGVRDDEDMSGCPDNGCYKLLLTV